MLKAAEIRRFMTAASAMLAQQRDLAAFEIYCTSSEQIVARLNYTGEIPSRGVEEVKSLAADGFAIRIVTRRDQHETGSAFIAGDLSIEGVKRALRQALGSTVIDPAFPGLPARSGAPRSKTYGPGDLLETSHLAVARAAWKTLAGAMREFARRVPRELRNPGLIIGGDFTLTRERIAVAGRRCPKSRTDHDAYFTAAITVIMEAIAGQGDRQRDGTLGHRVAALRSGAGPRRDQKSA